MTKKKEQQELPNQTSFMLVDDKIIEQVYDEIEGNRFAIWDGKKVIYNNLIEIEDIKYIPISGEEVFKKAILLPTKAEEYGTDEELDKEIMDYISKWLDIPEDYKMFSLWNIKRSWVYEKFHTLNYLRALGDTGMGKSRFLDTLGYIHYKSIATSGATTSAPIFRIINKWKGTLIIDEADFGRSDESQDIIKIINTGYENGKHIMRCDQNDANTINFFDPFCPKILATRKSFEDKAVESRCITTVMKGTENPNIPLNLNKDFFNTTNKLRNKLLMWRFKNFNSIDPDKKIDFDLGDLEPRVKQIVSSFVSLFINDKKQLEKFKIFITKYQEDLIQERQSSFDGAIVGAMYSLIKKGMINISATDIIEEAEFTDYKTGKPLNGRALTSRLKALGFEKTTPKRIDNIVKKCIPFSEKFIKYLFKRYGFDCNCVTVVTVVTESPQNGIKGEKGQLRSHSNNGYNSNIVTENLQDFEQIKPKEEEIIEEELIHLKCDICQETPCNYWDNGKPVCSNCFGNLTFNKH